MSLNWSILQCKDHEKMWLLDEPDADGTPMYKLDPVTEGLIWLTMLVDMGKITEDSWPEFYTRVKLYEFYTGYPYFHGYTITPDTIKRHIGLSTNVSNNKTSWNKKVRRWHDEFINKLKKGGDTDKQT